MTEPYRSFDLCEEYRGYHGRLLPVQVWRNRAWRWGPFSGGTVQWGDEIHGVFATPWFSFWWLRERTSSPSEKGNT